MALTNEDLTILTRPFRAADHSFLQGFTYLTEDAIAARLDEADPSWTFSILNVRYEGAQCIVTATMTVKGVSRDGVGMQKVNEKVGEADKGAATDALKRCARLFGIGRYLLDAPKGNGDKASADFNQWLADRQREAGMGNPSQSATGNAPASAQEPRNITPLTNATLGQKHGPIKGDEKMTRVPGDDDMTVKGVAKRFIEHWRAQSLTDEQVLEALGVERLSQWTQGRKAADTAVETWLYGTTDGADVDVAYTQTAQYWNARKHFDNWLAQQYPDGVGGIDTAELIAAIEADRHAQGKERQAAQAAAAFS